MAAPGDSADPGGAGYRVQAVADGAFNYDQTVPVETSQRSYRDTWTVALGGISNQAGPFSIPLEPQVSKYLMANTCALETTISVGREDGTECDGIEDLVAPADQLARIMWKDVDVSLNGHEIDSQCSVHANYKAVIEDLFSNNQDTRLTQMVNYFHHADTPGEFENMSVDEDTIIKLMVQAIEQGRVAVGPQFQYPAGMRLPGEEGYVAPVPPPANRLEELSMRATRLRRRHQHLTTACRQFIRNNHAANARTVSSSMRSNKGFCARYRLSAGSARINLIAPISHDFFNMDNHIGPGNRVEVKLTRSPDSFLLNTYLPARYKIRLHDIKLHVHTITRRESVPVPLVERYRYNETHMRLHSIGQGATNYTYRLHYWGVLPKTVILGMVATEAAEGSYHLNPLNFQHFGLRYLALDINGEEYPSGGLQFDFGQHPTPHMARGYRWIFENSGALQANTGNLISFPGFETGQFLIPFDLTPDKCNGLHNHQPETGHINVRLKFSRPLAVPVTMVAELVFNKVMINDKGRGVVKSSHVAA